MDVAFAIMKNAVIGFLASVVLLTGCTAAAPAELETETHKTGHEPLMQGQSHEEAGIQGSSQGEDLGEASAAGAEDNMAPALEPGVIDIEEREKWIF